MIVMMQTLVLNPGYSKIVCVVLNQIVILTSYIHSERDFNPVLPASITESLPTTV